MPRLTVAECRRRFDAADHAYLATTGADLRPHVVPVVFALHGDEVAVTVDGKPKTTTELRRLRNVRQNPYVAFLVDSYDADWHRLWWVRADALARVVETGQELDAAILRLRVKYPQYAGAAPAGPVVLAEVERWSGWSASEPQQP